MPRDERRGGLSGHIGHEPLSREQLAEECAELAARVEALEQQNNALRVGVDGLRSQIGIAARSLNHQDGARRAALEQLAESAKKLELAELQRDVCKEDVGRLLRALEVYRAYFSDNPSPSRAGQAEAIQRWEGEEGHRYPVNSKAPR